MDSRRQKNRQNQNNLDICGKEPVLAGSKPTAKLMPLASTSASSKKEQGKLESNGLLEIRKSPTIQDVATTRLDNTSDAFDCRSNKPSTSKDQIAAGEIFTIDDNEIPLSSDIIVDTLISDLPLDQLMTLYSVSSTDNFDDLDI